MDEFDNERVKKIVYFLNSFCHSPDSKLMELQWNFLPLFLMLDNNSIYFIEFMNIIIVHKQ